jgi:hypothetical protein
MTASLPTTSQNPVVQPLPVANWSALSQGTLSSQLMNEAMAHLSYFFRGFVRIYFATNPNQIIEYFARDIFGTGIMTLATQLGIRAGREFMIPNFAKFLNLDNAQRFTAGALKNEGKPVNQSIYDTLHHVQGAAAKMSSYVARLPYLLDHLLIQGSAKIERDPLFYADILSEKGLALFFPKPNPDRISIPPYKAFVKWALSNNIPLISPYFKERFAPQTWHDPAEAKVWARMIEMRLRPLQYLESHLKGKTFTGQVETSPGTWKAATITPEHIDHVKTYLTRLEGLQKLFIDIGTNNPNIDPRFDKNSNNLDVVAANKLKTELVKLMKDVGESTDLPKTHYLGQLSEMTPDALKDTIQNNRFMDGFFNIFRRGLSQLGLKTPEKQLFPSPVQVTQDLMDLFKPVIAKEVGEGAHHVQAIFTDLAKGFKARVGLKVAQEASKLFLETPLGILANIIAFGLILTPFDSYVIQPFQSKVSELRGNVLEFRPGLPIAAGLAALTYSGLASSTLLKTLTKKISPLMGILVPGVAALIVGLTVPFALFLNKISKPGKKGQRAVSLSDIFGPEKPESLKPLENKKESAVKELNPIPSVPAPQPQLYFVPVTAPSPYAPIYRPFS